MHTFPRGLPSSHPSPAQPWNILSYPLLEEEREESTEGQTQHHAEGVGSTEKILRVFTRELSLGPAWPSDPLAGRKSAEVRGWVLPAPVVGYYLSN